MTRREKPVKVHGQYRSQGKTPACSPYGKVGIGTAVIAGTAYALAGGHLLLAAIMGIAAGLLVYSLARLLIPWVKEE